MIIHRIYLIRPKLPHPNISDKNWKVDWPNPKWIMKHFNVAILKIQPLDKITICHKKKATDVLK